MTKYYLVTDNTNEPFDCVLVSDLDADKLQDAINKLQEEGYIAEDLMEELVDRGIAKSINLEEDRIIVG